MTDRDTVLVVTASGELHTKSNRTRTRFRRVLRDNLRAALARRAPGATLDRDLDGARLIIRAPDLERAAEAAADVFGVHRVERARRVPFESLEQLAAAVRELAGAQVAGRRFAVRVRRRGHHPFTSMDAARVIGQALLDLSAGVDLTDPEVEVPVLITDSEAWVVDRAWEGAGGLPLGTQEPCLVLLSGGFDSPVAAWMVMRRGCPVEFLHIRLDCAQTDHALAVARDLWARWGAGTDPLVWVVDFEGVERALREQVPARLRQVVLKQLMFAAADRLAAERGIPALVTGEAIGQVSSQTLAHLAEIDRVCERLVLRPLAGMDKQDIIALARRIGTHDLSARAKEVCNLAGDAPVAVAARQAELDAARAQIPGAVVEAALSQPEVVALSQWFPGSDPVPVVAAAPADVPVVERPDGPTQGPVAVTGPQAPWVATRLRAAGRDVVVVADGWIRLRPGSPPGGTRRRPRRTPPPSSPPAPRSAATRAAGSGSATAG